MLEETVELLSELIRVPRVSREEGAAADVLERWMRVRGLSPLRLGNNLILGADSYDASRETLLLNAHIDTVRPAASWTRDPHRPDIADGRLYGLGSNDCGGGLVTLLAAYMGAPPSGRNLLYVASAEEEVSGKDGMERVVRELPAILGVTAEHLTQTVTAIVGEPTGLQPAVAEKGLMVIDMTARGRAGHAARREGVNAIYEALGDMEWVRSHSFGRVSQYLGPTLMQLTVCQAGTQHNVVPDECRMVVDVRTNELYTNEEVFRIIDQATRSECRARSFRLRPSRIDGGHWLVGRCRELGLQPFGSPTLSDQALMPWPSLKLGPGQSSRSHGADEFICLTELQEALALYRQLLS